MIRRILAFLDRDADVRRVILSTARWCNVTDHIRATEMACLARRLVRWHDGNSVALDKVASFGGRCDARATRLRHVIRVYLA
jgi:hypothetical protein